MDETEHTRRVYNEIARKYHDKRLDPQEGAWNLYLEAPAMFRLLKPLVDGKRVLDLGCGTGLLTREILDWGGRVKGVDLSEQMIKIARRECPNIEFSVAKATDLPFADAEFDLVASSLMMHYIKDFERSFHEISRVLKQNGNFVFSIHHPLRESLASDDSPRDGRHVMRPYFNNDEYRWKMCGVELVSYHHTFEDIVRSLKGVGLRVEDLIECRPDPRSEDSFEDFESTSLYPTFCVIHASR